jgi:hypothetical protein
MSKWLKLSLKIVGGLLLLLIIALVGLSIYVRTHKPQILSRVVTALNKNLNGKLAVGGVETSIFKNFPNFSVTLTGISVKDNEWARHHQTLLEAQKLDVAIDVVSLIGGNISIQNIGINDAAIDLYTDSTGYSNTSVFKKSTSKKDTTTKSKSSLQIGKFSLKNVTFTVDDQRAKKLFKFVINELKSKMNYPDSGLNAKMHLNLLAKSMAFSTERGSFIKDKVLNGDLDVGYNKKTRDINVKFNDFTIGGDDFKITARFALANKPAKFTFYIIANKLPWRHASELVSANITKKLNMFNMDKPLAVTALIAGNLTGGGDPLLFITADLKNSSLTIPGNVLNNCSFKGTFTNNHVKGAKLGDENSIIRLFNFTGSLGRVPFTMDTCSVINLIKPVAAGNFKSNFPVTDLNDLLGASLAKFDSGTAAVALRFNADVVNFQIAKPFIRGSINLTNADVNYIPVGLKFKNTSISLNFVDNDLIIKNFRIQTGKSILLMEARVNNFLNLYYNSPEKILLNYQITSPQLYLEEFLGFLNRGKSEAPPKKQQTSGNSANSIAQIYRFLNNAKVSMNIHAAKVHYFKGLATDVTAELLLSNNGFRANNVGLKNSGGSLKINGELIRQVPRSSFTLSAVVSKVDIRQFFYEFDNFGLKGISYQNLRGSLSANAQIKGMTNNAAGIVPGSLNGPVTVNLKNGQLLEFQPLLSVGKFVFPFRNLHKIDIAQLDAKFDVQGNNITIHPMQISSSVLNADVAGVYSLANETDVTMDVPLRDPKDDAAIADPAERAKKRYKGIVVHVRAKSDEKGKLKISRNKDYKKK